MDLGYYNNKKILITGGAGYLGSNVLKMLGSVSCRVTVFDVKGAELPFLEDQKADILLTEGDIRDKNIWLKLIKDIDIIFHFAAQTSSKLANENPVMDSQINQLPLEALLEVCRKENMRPDIIFSGTVTQVGLTENWPVDESFQDNPATFYDIHKLAAEKSLSYYSRQMKGRSVVLRLANLYGPGPKSSRVDRGILNMMVKKALLGEALTVYGEGEYIRDYIYIDDVVQAFLFAGANLDKTSGKYFVIGSEKGHSIKEMICLIQEKVEKRTGKRVEIKSDAVPENLSLIEFRNFVADSKAFRSAVGWRARISLEEGIDKTIDFFYRSFLK